MNNILTKPYTFVAPFTIGVMASYKMYLDKSRPTCDDDGSNDIVSSSRIYSAFRRRFNRKVSRDVSLSFDFRSSSSDVSITILMTTVNPQGTGPTGAEAPEPPRQPTRHRGQRCPNLCPCEPGVPSPICRSI